MRESNKKYISMKTLTLFISLILASSIFAQKVTVNTLPKSTDEFIALRNEIATTPEGGATMFLLALKIYTENKPLGEQCLVLATDKNLLRKGDTYKGYSLFKTDLSTIKRQIATREGLANSYISGSSPQNNYSVKLPYTYNFSTNAYCGDAKEGKFKLFVKCSGADSPRPIYVKKNSKGIWKASSWSSILVGIRKPVADTVDDL